jgi:hypothetical protein
MKCQCPHPSVDHPPNKCNRLATRSAIDKKTLARVALCPDCLLSDYRDIHPLGDDESSLSRE